MRSLVINRHKHSIDLFVVDSVALKKHAYDSILRFIEAANGNLFLSFDTFDPHQPSIYGVEGLAFLLNMPSKIPT